MSTLMHQDAEFYEVHAQMEQAARDEQAQRIIEQRRALSRLRLKQHQQRMISLTLRGNVLYPSQWQS